jgi:hypothetical protein
MLMSVSGEVIKSPAISLFVRGFSPGPVAAIIVKPTNTSTTFDRSMPNPFRVAADDSRVVEAWPNI